MSYISDSDDTDEVLELRQAIIDLIGILGHDKDNWIVSTLYGGKSYVSPATSKALDRALLLAIKQR